MRNFLYSFCKSLKLFQTKILKNSPGGVAQLVSVVPICQGCRFDPWSGHIQQSTNECINCETTN